MLFFRKEEFGCKVVVIKKFFSNEVVSEILNLTPKWHKNFPHFLELRASASAITVTTHLAFITETAVFLSSIPLILHTEII